MSIVLNKYNDELVVSHMCFDNNWQTQHPEEVRHIYYFLKKRNPEN